MAGRLDGKRVIVTDPTEYNGADIVSLFREEGAEVFAEPWDLTKSTMADDIVREVGHVDILIANLAYPHKYLPVYEKTDADLEYAMKYHVSVAPADPRGSSANAAAQAGQDRRRRERHQPARPQRGRVDLRRCPGSPAWLHEECRDGSRAVRQRERHCANLCR
jgi:NAD(P)-dependent dehydrogenase (short-subunit alcohol dehydrogenase family)